MHRPMARCRFDRVKRRSRYVAHQRPPGKSSRVGDSLFYVLFVPFAACYESPEPDTANVAPRSSLTGAAVRPRDSLRTPAQTDRRPHLIDETFGGEECAAEKLRARERIHVAGERATCSRVDFAAQT